MCQYAAEHGATEAVIKVEPENSASARVALRAGFAFVRRICEQDGTVFDRYERVLRAKMHADEVDIDEDLVRRLLRAQFPQWADLPIAPVRSAGTDNAMYRLGEDLAVRIPRIGWAIESLRTEQQWLPRIAAHLGVASPVPVGLGSPAEGFGWPWSVCRWVAGENPSAAEFVEPNRAVEDLADFITALRATDPMGGPPAKRVRRWGAGCRGTRSAGGPRRDHRRPRGNCRVGISPTRSSVCGAADVVPR